MDALDMLINRDCRTMSGLADRLRVNRSTATRAVDRLVTDGLVERFPSPDDGRVVLVRITAEGRRRHKTIDALNAKNEGFKLLFATSSGKEVSMGLADVVRAYPANRLGF